MNVLHSSNRPKVSATATGPQDTPALAYARQQRAGGVAALYLAAAFLASMPYFLIVVNWANLVGSAQKVTALVANQNSSTRCIWSPMWYLGSFSPRWLWHCGSVWRARQASRPWVARWGSSGPACSSPADGSSTTALQPWSSSMTRARLKQSRHGRRSSRWHRGSN